jgi:hypothetical protein
MTDSTPRAYRAAIWLYPRSFRREFGADLDQAYRGLRQDHSAFATWRRVTADLALTIPTQHLETLMARTTSAPAVTLASGAVLLAAVATAVASGTAVIFLPALIIGAAALLAYWRSRTPYREAVRDSSRLWLWFIGAGVGVFALLIGASEIHDDWDWFPWRLLILSVFAGCALIATGVLLAFVHLIHRLAHRQAGV